MNELAPNAAPHAHPPTLPRTVRDVLKKRSAQQWEPDAGEQFEDSLGNVLDRRTYEDLSRQGLL